MRYENNSDAWLLYVNPELSEWKCYLFGSPELVVVPQKGSVPNWFWRKMQYLILGFKWVKNPKEQSAKRMPRRKANE